MTQGTLLGFRKFNSKKGNPLCTVEISYPYSNSDYNDGNAIGSRTISAFVPRGFDANTLTEKSVGKTFNIETAFYNSQNNLVYMQEA